MRTKTLGELNPVPFVVRSARAAPATGTGGDGRSCATRASAQMLAMNGVGWLIYAVAAQARIGRRGAGAGRVANGATGVAVARRGRTSSLAAPMCSALSCRCTTRSPAMATQARRCDGRGALALQPVRPPERRARRADPRADEVHPHGDDRAAYACRLHCRHCAVEPGPAAAPAVLWRRGRDHPDPVLRIALVDRRACMACSAPRGTAAPDC